VASSESPSDFPEGREKRYITNTNKYYLYLRTGHGRFAIHYDLSFLKPFYSREIKMF
jgi:hypothetical protein